MASEKLTKLQAYDVGARAKELVDCHISKVRKAYSSFLDVPIENTKGMTRGQMIEKILVERFTGNWTN